MAREVIQWGSQELTRFAAPRVQLRANSHDYFLVRRRTGRTLSGAVFQQITISRITYHNPLLYQVTRYLGRAATLVVLRRLSRRWRDSVDRTDAIEICSWRYEYGPFDRVGSVPRLAYTFDRPEEGGD